MKKFIKILLMSICAMLFVAEAAMALPVSLSDNSLQDFFDSQGWSIDAANDQLPMPAGWSLPPTTSQASMTFWREDFSEGIAFGIYSLAGGQLAEVFDAGDTPIAAAVVGFQNTTGQEAVVIQTQDAGGFTMAMDQYSFSGESFGFYIATGTFGSYTQTLYSDPTMNGDMTTLLLYKPSGGQYIFAGDIDGDGDFSDIVTQAESIAPVPEPATMLLLGVGLVGLAGVGRKKFAKNR